MTAAEGALIDIACLQAALVADSPYYKVLIGRILGYAEPNIRHHILVSCVFLLTMLRGGAVLRGGR
jgi:hypothetical protein